MYNDAHIEYALRSFYRSRYLPALLSLSAVLRLHPLMHMSITLIRPSCCIFSSSYVCLYVEPSSFMLCAFSVSVVYRRVVHSYLAVCVARSTMATRRYLWLWNCMEYIIWWRFADKRALRSNKFFRRCLINTTVRALLAMVCCTQPNKNLRCFNLALTSAKMHFYLF